MAQQDTLMWLDKLYSSATEWVQTIHTLAGWQEIQPFVQKWCSIMKTPLGKWFQISQFWWNLFWNRFSRKKSKYIKNQSKYKSVHVTYLIINHRVRSCHQFNSNHIMARPYSIYEQFPENVPRALHVVWTLRCLDVVWYWTILSIFFLLESLAPW